METNGRTHLDPILMNQLSQSLDKLVTNLVSSRRELYSKIDDPRRNIDQECGYPDTSKLSPEHYRNMYDRHPIAARVVECFPKECWQFAPTVYEDEDTEKITEFEKKWDEITKTLRGNSWFKDEEGNPIWSYLLRLDILSRIGSFGVMILGVNDGADRLHEPIPGFEEGEPEKPVNVADSLLYLSVFDESLVDINTYEEDTGNPRYGKPTEYQITLNDPKEMHSGIGLKNDSVRVHWSRVIHVADNLANSDIFGVPAQRPVYNNLLDLKKLYGGSAEGQWRGAFPGLSIESHPQLGGDIEFDLEAVQDAVERYANTLQRYLAIEGASVKSLTPQISDPTNQIKVQLEAIAIILGIPMRIFMGSERGQLASGQDDSTWNERKQARQQLHITPNIIVPFVDRLIRVGVLPMPEEFHVVWQDLDALSDAEQADLAVKRVEAITKFAAGGGDTMIDPMDFWVRIMGMEEKEAAEILEKVKEHLKEANPDAEEGEIVPGRNPTPPALQGQPIPGQEGKQGPPKPGAPKPLPPGQQQPPKDQNTENTFCPTGQGGGIDPTCGGGVGSYSGIKKGSRTEKIARELSAMGQLSYSRDREIWEAGAYSGKTAGEAVRAFAGKKYKTLDEKAKALRSDIDNLQKKNPNHKIGQALQERLDDLEKKAFEVHGYIANKRGQRNVKSTKNRSKRS